MISFFSMVVANFKMTVRNRQALFWLFVFPILLMSLLGIVFGGANNQTAKIGIVVADEGRTAKSIYESFSAIEAFNVKKLNRAEALSRLKAGDLDAVLVMEKNFAKGIEVNPRQIRHGISSKHLVDNQLKPAKIQLYYDPSSTLTSQAVRSAVNTVLGEINQKMSNTPEFISFDSHSVRSNDLNYIDFLVPGIIAMTLMNSALFGLGGTVVNYRERGILRRLKVTPQPLTGFIAAQISNQLIFSILRAALLILVARLFFGVAVIGDFFSLLIVIIIGSLTFVTIAFSVASFAPTRETADTLSNIISLPMMFLGGVFFPVESAPKWIQPVINVLPLKYLGDAMRDVMVRGESILAVGVRSDLYILLSVTLVFFVLSIRLWKWE